MVAGGGLLTLVMTVPIALLLSSGHHLLAATGIAVSYNIAGLVGGFVPSLALALQTQLGDTVWVIGLLFAIIVAMTAIGGRLSGAAVHKRLQRS